MRDGIDRVRGYKHLNLIAVLLSTLLIIAPITAITLKDGLPTRGLDSCDSCHGGRYDLVIEDPVLTAPADIDIGETDQVTVSVSVTADGTNSYWEFNMVVKLVSVNSKVSVPAQVTFSNQRPAGSSQPYTWSRDVNFDITGLSGGTDTLRAETTMNADHFGNNLKTTDTATIVVNNDPPQLTSGGHEPDSGDTDTMFRFNITYSDPNDQQPTSIDVIIGGSRYPLQITDGTLDSIITGEEYSTTVFLESGQHQYHFEASDGTDTARFPVSGELTGPTVITANTAPNLSDPEVSPDSSICNDTFRFSVTYTDDENDPPQDGVKLLLNGSLHPTSMTPVGGNTNYLTDGVFDNGERFEIELQLPCGNYQYGFNVTDGDFFDEIGPFSGPIVSEVPILVADILEPEDGAIFSFESTINLTSSFSSNVEITDAVYQWRSNISGYLGSFQKIQVVLESGIHLISLNISSSEHGIFDSDSIIVEVEEYVVPPFFLSWEPEGDVTIREDENLSFRVRVNPDHPSVNEDMRGSVFYSVDNVISALQVFDWVFEPTYNDSGVRNIVFGAWLEEPLEKEYYLEWNITVIDVPAPIIINSEPELDLGTYKKRDYINITLDLEDPLRRELSVLWSVGDRIIDSNGTSLSLKLNQGPWAQIGDHILSAVISNPDGTRMWYNFTYTLMENETSHNPDNDDDIDVDDDNTTFLPSEEENDRRLFASLKDDRAGALILLAGLIALILGIIWAVYVLVRPANKPQPTTVRDREE